MKRSLVTVPLAAGCGLALGWLLHELRNPRKLEEKTVELSPATWSITPKEFKDIRGVLYDVHKNVLAVSKALRKPTT
jgi:hypothetical protein